MSTGRGNRRRDANASDAIAAILHPHEGYREKLQRKGVTPKDFERENKLRVKKLQAENRERRRREEASQAEEFKLTRFKGVRPRVFREEEHDTGERMEKHVFLRRGGAPSPPGSGSASTSSPPSVSSARQSSRGATASAFNLQSPSHSAAGVGQRSHRVHRKAPVPSLRELEQRDAALAKMSKMERVDYVNANAWEVIKAPSTRSNQEEEAQARPSRRDYGRIPRYLLERKEQWAREEEERRLNAPDPDCPPGMVLLDEEERIRTLRVLHKSLGEAQRRMNALPLSIETMMQIRRKNALETKLQEIEDAIKVFDRAKVYVAAPLTGTSEQGRERTGSVAA